MGVYVRFPDGSMHWDESKADPSDSGGSVLNAATGQAIPGANRQSGSTGPGGNGPRGSQANPNGDYHAGPPVGGGVFGSGGFTGGTQGVAPLGQPGDFTATPFADWVTKLLGSQQAQSPAAPSAGPATAPANPPAAQASPNDWFALWAQRQQADAQAQRMQANMQAMPNPFVQSGISEGSR